MLPSANLLSCSFSYHVQDFHINEYILPTYLFRLQTEGVAHALVDGELTKVEPGDLLLYHPGDRYELRIEGASGDYFLFCSGVWIDEWWKKSPRAQLSHLQVSEELIVFWKLLILERRRLTKENGELLSYLLQAFCIQIDRALRESGSVKPHRFIVTRMKRYIEKMATQPLKVSEVATHVRLSASRAAHLFKEIQGESIMQYALRVRLSMAAERMKFTALTLEQIAESCGLGSYPYFHRVFKAHYGASPRAYRRSLQEQ